MPIDADQAMKDIYLKFRQERNEEAVIHYITFRSAGGFGIRVAACLAATQVMKEDLKPVHLETSGDRASKGLQYVKDHAALVAKLKNAGEVAYQQLVSNGVVT